MLKKVEEKTGTRHEIEAFNKLLSKPPKRIKTEKRGGKEIAYVPINDIENMLKMLFLQYKIELISYQVVANSIACHVRVHYLHPVTGEWLFHDGIGAKAIQLNSGALPTDFTQIKSDAIEKCLPAAKSQAIKNAVKHLGKLFGAGLNTDSPEYEAVYAKHKINKAWEINEQADKEEGSEDDE